MALAESVLASLFSSFPLGTADLTTPSFTPTVGARLLALMSGQHTGGTSDPSASFTCVTSGLTWTKIANAGDTVSWSHGAAIFLSDQISSGSSITVATGTGGARNMWWMHLEVIQVTGQHASPLGVFGAQNTTSASGTFSCTLSGTPAASSRIYGIASVLGGGSSVNTGGAGYTKLDDDFDADAGAVMEQYRTGSTSTNYSASTVSASEKAVLVAVEIIAAADGATGTVNATNANDTSAASGTTTVTGTLARTNANDTSAASGIVGAVSGSVAYTNANDTSAAAGTTTVTGTVARSNNNDTSAASGTTTVTGTLARTNANDTAAASGTAGAVTGTVAYTNNNDTCAANGFTPPLFLDDTHDPGIKKKDSYKEYREKRQRRKEQLEDAFPKAKVVIAPSPIQTQKIDIQVELNTPIIEISAGIESNIESDILEEEELIIMLL